MPDFVRLAKFSPPRQNTSVTRKRLFEQLDTLLNTAAVWIAAPPGAGKTTLVASYLEHRNTAACWYRLDVSDLDLVAFFDSFSKALITDATSRKKPFLKFRSEHTGQIDTFSRRYFQDIFSRETIPGALVIDNIHTVTNQPVMDILRILIEEAPIQIDLFLISRTDPPEPFVTLFAQRQLVQLDANELRFTLDETRDLFTDRDADFIAEVQTFTEGWVAGMILMSIQHGQPDSIGAADPSELHHATREAVFHFFASEILHDLPQSEQTFLCLTALLPDISIAHARALTSNRQAAPLLKRYYRQHLFISYRRGPPDSYQFHDLFRSFLLSHADQLLDADVLKTARLKAADLLLQEDNVPAALELLRHAGQWQQLRQVLIATAPKLLRHGRFMTLRHEIKLLMDEVSGTDIDDAWICYWMGLACIREDEMTGMDWIERAYTEFEQFRLPLGQILCAASAINTLHASWEAHLGFTTWAMRLRNAILPADLSLDPSQDLEISTAIVSSAFYGECTSYSDQTIDETVEHILCLIEHQHKKLNVNAIGIAGRVLLENYMLQGSQARSERIIALIEPLLKGTAVSPMIRGLWLTYVACFRIYMDYLGNITAARLTDYAEWNEGVAIAQREQLVLLGFSIAYCEVQVAMVRDEREHFPALLEALRERVDFSKPAPAAIYYSAKCWMHLWRNEIPLALEAGEHMTACIKNAALTLTSADRMWLCLRYSYALMASHREDEAIACIQSNDLDNAQHRYRIAKGLILLIRAVQMRRLGEDHVPCLREGLTCMAQNNFAIFFNALPGYAAQICCDALKFCIEPDFVRRCIIRRGLTPPPDANEFWPWPIRIHVLGNFAVEEDDQPVQWGAKTPRKQLELLQAIAIHNRSGLSKQQILDWFLHDANDEQSSFRVALHRLRKLFKNEHVIVLEDQCVTLNPDFVWVDLTNFESHCARLLKMNLHLTDEIVLQREANTLLSIYCGQLLSNLPAAPWITPTRERLKNQFRQAVHALGAALEAQQSWQLAIDLYSRGVMTDPLAEDFYAGQIRCYVALEEPGAAMMAFRDCRELLSIVLGLKPSAKIQALVNNIIESN